MFGRTLAVVLAITLVLTASACASATPAPTATPPTDTPAPSPTPTPLVGVETPLAVEDIEVQVASATKQQSHLNESSGEYMMVMNRDVFLVVELEVSYLILTGMLGVSFLLLFFPIRAWVRRRDFRRR